GQSRGACSKSGRWHYWGRQWRCRNLTDEAKRRVKIIYIYIYIYISLKLDLIKRNKSNKNERN
ncbi:MAG: hypothetical protein N7Q72_06350, partial [Spiroplasma sp. Tabriz.8]|nr:hypothetical protein [Spiroplasma sp. Tabriz.8]